MNDTAKLLRSLAIDRQDDARTPSAAGRWRRPMLALAATAAVIAAGAALWFALQTAPARMPEADTARTQTPAAKPNPAPAASQEPRRAGALIASGYVVARRKATIAAEITGKVVELLVDEGMTVQPGPGGRAARQRARRKGSRAGAIARRSGRGGVGRDHRRPARRRAHLRRAPRPCRRQNFASEADLTKARGARRRAHARSCARRRRSWQTARLDAKRSAAVLDKHQIRAPFSGVVVERSAQPGEMISPMSAGGFTRTGVCTIVDMDSIEIEVDVNEAFIGRVSAGRRRQRRARRLSGLDDSRPR